MDLENKEHKSLISKLKSLVQDQKELSVEFDKEYGPPISRDSTDQDVETLQALGYLH